MVNLILNYNNLYQRFQILPLPPCRSYGVLTKYINNSYKPKRDVRGNERHLPRHSYMHNSCAFPVLRAVSLKAWLNRLRFVYFK